MAQTQTHAHNETVPAPQNGLDADTAAWCAAAKVRKARIEANVVYGYVGGKLVPIPAPKGFSGLEPLFQPFAFECLYQGTMNRVVKGAEGNVIEKIANLYTNGQHTPNVQDTKDAFDNCYWDFMDDLIATKAGPWNVDESGKEIPESNKAALKKARAARDEIVEAHLAPFHDKYYVASIKQALAATANVKETEKKRQPKAAKVSNVKVMDL